MNCVQISITCVMVSKTRQLIINFSNHHRGAAIFRSDYKETFSSVDNVQFLSCINPHDGTVINGTVINDTIRLKSIMLLNSPIILSGNSY